MNHFWTTECCSHMSTREWTNEYLCVISRVNESSSRRIHQQMCKSALHMININHIYVFLISLLCVLFWWNPNIFLVSVSKFEFEFEFMCVTEVSINQYWKRASDWERIFDCSTKSTFDVRIDWSRHAKSKQLISTRYRLHCTLDHISSSLSKFLTHFSCTATKKVIEERHRRAQQQHIHFQQLQRKIC